MVAKTIELPNIRKMFIPDEGMVLFDADLDRADLQVVVWEANDPELKAMLREGIDLHIENAKVLFGKTAITKESPERQFAKTFIHGTNYGGGARTMAMHTGVTTHTAEVMQSRWFSAHPRIKSWHDRVFAQLEKERKISNRFGNTRRYFDRIDGGLLGQALAWIPQSTVACVINRGLKNIDTNLPWCELLLQVHDSLVGQFPIKGDESLARNIDEIRRQMLIEVPYDDPLIIPVGIKISPLSWGDVEEYKESVREAA